jgi:hypothetical protein
MTSDGCGALSNIIERWPAYQTTPNRNLHQIDGRLVENPLVPFSSRWQPVASMPIRPKLDPSFQGLTLQTQALCHCAEVSWV